ncbi:MAG: hypothetical protein ACFFDT_22210, partial [Candidatus Hodarchaeota archaeon]
DLTAVVISDANGNELPELILESDRGIVHSYEITSKFSGQADILTPIKEIVLQHTDSNDGAVMNIIPVDINKDDIEDLLYCTEKGKLVAVDGLTFQTIYKSGISSTSNSWPGLQLIKNKDTEEPIAVAFANLGNFSLFNLEDGKLITSVDFGFVDVVTINAGDLLLDQTEVYEVLVGLENATIIAYSIDLGNYALDELWRASHPDTAQEIHEIRIGIFSNQSQPGVVATSHEGSIGDPGYIMSLNGSTGDFLWNQSLTYPVSLVVADLNDDGISDVVAGLTPTFAFDGLTGDQLWNMSGSMAITEEPITYDVNNDTVPDILFGKFGINGAGAINGATGEYLWNYSLTVSDFPLTMTYRNTIGTIQMNKTLDVYAGLSVDGIAYLLEPKSGIALTGMPTTSSLDPTFDYSIGSAIAIAQLSFDRPVIIIGDYNSNITVYSLYYNKPKVTEVTNIPTATAELKGSIAEERTRQLKLALPSYITHDIDSDGIDDLIIVDSSEIKVVSVFDSSVFWTLSIDTDWGSYHGPAKLADVNEDGQIELVAAYDQYVTAITLSAAAPTYLWNCSFVGVGAPDSWNYGEFLISDIDGNPGLEIVWGGTYIAFNWARIGIINGITGVKSILNQSQTYDEVLFNIGDLRNSGTKDIVAYFTESDEVFGGLLAIYNYMGTLIVELPLQSYPLIAPPVSNIAVGEFSVDYSGLEFVLFFEWSSIGWEYPDFLLNWGTMYVGYALDASYQLQAVYSALDYLDTKIEHWVKDYDNNGIDDLVVLSNEGHLLVMNGSTASLEILGKQTDVLVDYSKPKTLVGNFLGTDSYVTAAYNSLTYYDSFFFGEIPIPAWYVPLEGTAIRYMRAGDFDTDDYQDVLIIDLNYDLWIVSSEGNFGRGPPQKPDNNLFVPAQKILNTSKRSTIADIIPILFIILVTVIGMAATLVTQRHYRRK